MCTSASLLKAKYVSNSSFGSFAAAPDSAGLALLYRILKLVLPYFALSDGHGSPRFVASYSA
mgnify:CR=1 FL=1